MYPACGSLVATNHRRNARVARTRSGIRATIAVDRLLEVDDEDRVGRDLLERDERLGRRIDPDVLAGLVGGGVEVHHRLDAGQGLQLREDRVEDLGLLGRAAAVLAVVDAPL